MSSEEFQEYLRQLGLEVEAKRVVSGQPKQSPLAQADPVIRFFIEDEKLENLPPLIGMRTHVLTHLRPEDAEYLYHVALAAMNFLAFMKGINNVHDAATYITSYVGLYSLYRRAIHGEAARLLVSSFEYRQIQAVGERRRGFLGWLRERL